MACHANGRSSLAPKSGEFRLLFFPHGVFERALAAAHGPLLNAAESRDDRQNSEHGAGHDDDGDLGARRVARPDLLFCFCRRGVNNLSLGGLAGSAELLDLWRTIDS